LFFAKIKGFAKPNKKRISPLSDAFPLMSSEMLHYTFRMKSGCFDFQ